MNFFDRLDQLALELAARALEAKRAQLEAADAGDQVRDAGDVDQARDVVAGRVLEARETNADKGAAEGATLRRASASQKPTPKG